MSCTSHKRLCHCALIVLVSLTLDQTGLALRRITPLLR